MEGDTAPRSVVPSAMILILGSIPGLPRLFFSTIFCIRRFLIIYSSIFTLALRAHGLRRHYSFVPCGWEQSCQMGSYPGGVTSSGDQESQAGACSRFLWAMFLETYLFTAWRILLISMRRESSKREPFSLVFLGKKTI